MSHWSHTDHRADWGSREPCSSGTAFLLWLSCLLGVCGVHRFYLGKPWSGLLYLVTFGLFGIGQLFDLFYIREMVLLANTKARMLDGPPALKLLPPPPPRPVDTAEDLRVKLVRTAAQHNGQLSVSQGVMATGMPFQTVEKLLDEMAQSGYVGIDNDPQTGAVVYTFAQLSA